MGKTFNMPKYKRVIYQFNPATGHYQKCRKQPEPQPVNICPYELRRETTFGEQIKCNAAEMLTKRERKENGSRKTFTGLQPLPTIAANWYYGNIFRPLKGKKLKSDILIHFRDDGSVMELYLFPAFHMFNQRLREQFAAQAIPLLLAA